MPQDEQVKTIQEMAPDIEAVGCWIDTGATAEEVLSNELAKGAVSVFSVGSYSTIHVGLCTRWCGRSLRSRPFSPLREADQHRSQVCARRIHMLQHETVGFA